MSTQFIQGQQSSMLRRALFVFGLLLFAGPVWAQTYSTDFGGTESPLAEDGRWTNADISPPHTTVQTDGAHAFGTMDSFDGMNFPDSVACLAGFSPDHSITATVHNDDAGEGLEIELILRCSVTESGVTGYEIDIGPAFGLNIVRLNGGNDYALAAGFPITTDICVYDGNVWSASISGNLINVSCNGISIVTDLDITTAFGDDGLVISSGNPGVGFWNDTGASDQSTKFGWRNFSASD